MVTMFSIGYFTVLHLVARVYLKTVVDLPSTSRKERERGGDDQSRRME
jgi:hypothetical protein